METRKSKSADLEPKKSIFLEAGLIVSLGLTLAAFEWKSPVNEIVVQQDWEPVIDEVFIKNTYSENKKILPNLIKVPAIRIVDNNQNVTGDLIIDIEIKPDDILPEYIAPISVKLDDEKPAIEDVPFVIVENMPEFPGGMAALKEFIAANTEYPQTAAEIGVEGTVYLSFLIEKDGSISNIKTIRGIGGGCNEEAERVIRIMPNWKPGSQRGKPVRVSYTIPVIFELK